MRSLTEAVQQFLYTHMRQAPNQRELLKLVETVEFQYITKIQELEKRLDEKKGEPATRWDGL